MLLQAETTKLEIEYGKDWKEHLSSTEWPQIQKLVDENDLDRDTIEQTALDRFGVGVRYLNKLQASGLISELLESVRKNGNSRNGKGGRA